MVVCTWRDHPAAGWPLEQSLLQEIGLEHVLDRVLLLADRHRQRREADRPPAELGRHRIEQGAVGAVEAASVDLEHLKRRGRHLGVDWATLLDLGKIAHPLQQPVGDARRAAPAPWPRTTGSSPSSIAG